VEIAQLGERQTENATTIFAFSFFYTFLVVLILILFVLTALN